MHPAVSKLRIDPARARRVTLHLSVATLITVFVVWIASRVLAEDLWWTTLLLYLPQIGYAIPVAPLFLAALLLRDRRALFANGLSLALIAGPMMGFQIPSPTFAAVDSSPRVRVLSYNILGKDADFPGIRRQVVHYRPDVVVFSEAHHYRNAALLKRELREMFPGWQHVQGGDVYVASRWPIVDRQTSRLGPGTTDPSIDRRVVHAEVRAPFGRFHVVGVHFRTAAYGETLLRNWRRLDRYMRQTGRIRMEQAAATLHYLEELDGPVLLCGDFNTPPEGRIYQRLTASLTDSFGDRGAGWGHTYPSWFPMLRIDYVFHSKHWNVSQAETGSGRGSDHCPVFVELTPNDAR